MAFTGSEAAAVTGCNRVGWGRDRNWGAKRKRSQTVYRRIEKSFHLNDVTFFFVYFSFISSSWILHQYTPLDYTHTHRHTHIHMQKYKYTLSFNKQLVKKIDYIFRTDKKRRSHSHTQAHMYNAFLLICFKFLFFLFFLLSSSLISKFIEDYISLLLPLYSIYSFIRPRLLTSSNSWS